VHASLSFRHDILKACAPGADAVLLGRATLYGVSVGGQAGAGHVLDLLAQELRLALSLLGQPDLSPLDCRRLRLNPLSSFTVS
jgi:(S)-mandelate dehydrogenase